MGHEGARRFTQASHAADSFSVLEEMEFWMGSFHIFGYQVSDTAQKLVTCGMWCLMLLWYHSHWLYQFGKETLCGSFVLWSASFFTVVVAIVIGKGK